MRLVFHHVVQSTKPADRSALSSFPELIPHFLKLNHVAGQSHVPGNNVENEELRAVRLLCGNLCSRSRLIAIGF